ncbi:MAG TPA: tetratricopeptide repeat protein [Candidatus Acidoferrum sp.]|nr:tetratricopeptide repeat protein [Candidatus Acidoferrum sp.]
MKISAFAVVLWAASSLVPPPATAQSASTQQQVVSHAQKAAEYLREKRPDLAAPEFKAIVELEPDNVDARANLGVLLFFQGKYPDAIPQLREALKLNSDLPKIRALLGIAEKQTGDMAAARKDLDAAFPNVQDQKIRVQTGMELVEVDSAMGDLGKAAEIVNSLRQLEPTDEAILYTSYRIYSDLAEQSLLSLSLVAPNSAHMHQAMAHELAIRGDNAAAIENYRKALKLNPNLPGLHFELADMLNISNSPADRAEAKEQYEAALKVNPFDEQAECRLGEIAAQNDNLKEAQQRYAKAVELRPNDPDANLGLAKVFMDMGQPKKAQPLLEKAIQLDPTSAVAHFRLSTVYRELGRPDDAKHELAEYQKYKAMKAKLEDLYQAMRLVPAAKEQGGMGPQQ